MLATLSGKEPFLSRESLRLSATPMYFDDSKARRELGYVSRPHQEAIADAVRWFRDREALGAANTQALATMIECGRAAMRSLRGIALVLAGLYSYPADAEPSPGFTYCVAPFPPDCVKAPVNSDSHDDCETRVQAYVANVFRFRQCIEAESEREVRRANEVLDQWRCKVSRKECQH
jgi:hypothetical protein